MDILAGETSTSGTQAGPASRPHLALAAHHTSEADYDQAIGAFDGVSQEATAVFARARWPGLALQPWLYFHNSKAVAAALVMVQPLPMNLAKLAIVKWGPVLADETETQADACHFAAVDHLKDFYCFKQRMMLTIMQRAPAEPALATDRNLKVLGFKTGAGLEYPKRYLVRLRISDDDQRASLAQKWRYHLARSEKDQLEFHVAELRDTSAFDKLYQAMANRKNFPDYSAYATLPALAASPVAALRPKLFTVMHQGNAVAAAVIFAAGRTATYLYGATADKALPLRAGYFMQSRIVSWLRNNTKCEWYDLGGSDGFSGLHQFKKGLVGTQGLISTTPPVANCATTRWASFAGTSAYALRDLALDARRWAKSFNSKAGQPDMEPD